MAKWRLVGELVSEVNLSENDSLKLATRIASDVRFLPREAKVEIKDASPVPIRDRLRELQAFQAWMDLIGQSKVPAPVIRAQVITQNYICFVYLPMLALRHFQERGRGLSCQ
jgi:hypothetical protein